MKKIFISLLLLTAAITIQAQAISDTYAAEVRKTLKLQHSTETFIETMRLQMQQFVDNGTMTAEGLSDYCKEISDLLIPAMESKMIELYHNNFTLAELKQMNEFLSSPVGQKSVKLSPLLASETTKIVSSSEVQQQITSRLMKYVKK